MRWARRAASASSSSSRTLSPASSPSAPWRVSCWFPNRKRSLNDSDLATTCQNALKWDVSVPKGITVKVDKTVVTLDGQVSWNYQRDAAERAVRYLTGVGAVYNLITLKPQVSATQVKEKVEAALQRQATADANAIHIVTSGGKVTLTGTASSWPSIEDAANAAWAAPGVTEVVNQVHLTMY